MTSNLTSAGTDRETKLFRKKGLEIILGGLQPHPKPKVFLEQYTIPSEAASEVLFIAEGMYGDIRGKRVIDLGCGSGRLAIGSSLLGAEEVVGVDIDPLAVKTARENQLRAGVQRSIQWVVSDIRDIVNGFNTALQNPPFGVQNRGADRLFIQKGLEVAETVYTLHKSGEKNRAFIKKFVKENGGDVTDLFKLKFKIPWTYSFHRKRVKNVTVDLYRLERQ